MGGEADLGKRALKALARSERLLSQRVGHVVQLPSPLLRVEEQALQLLAHACCQPCADG